MFLSALPLSFPPDGEVWEWSEGVSHLLQNQHHLLSLDIRECLRNLGAAQSIVMRILHNPADKDCRSVRPPSGLCKCSTRTAVTVCALAAAKENRAVDEVP